MIFCDLDRLCDLQHPTALQQLPTPRPTRQGLMLDLYTILGLPSSEADVPVAQDELRAAYRSALLRSHPDKSTDTTCQSQSGFTVDDVTLAFKTLSDPVKQAKYLREKRLQRQFPETGSRTLPPNVETLDLDDFLYDEEAGQWTRPCRCGAEQGYLITENDLEDEAHSRAILVGCRDCSIWLQVHFEEARDFEVRAENTTEDHMNRCVEDRANT